MIPKERLQELEDAAKNLQKNSDKCLCGNCSFCEKINAEAVLLLIAEIRLLSKPQPQFRRNSPNPKYGPAPPHPAPIIISRPTISDPNRPIPPQCKNSDA